MLACVRACMHGMRTRPTRATSFSRPSMRAAHCATVPGCTTRACSFAPVFFTTCGQQHSVGAYFWVQKVDAHTLHNLAALDWSTRRHPAMLSSLKVE